MELGVLGLLFFTSKAKNKAIIITQARFDLFDNEFNHIVDNRPTQLLLPLKVAKSDFEPRIAEQLANDQGSCDSRGVLFLSLASCSAIQGSKSDFATFNASGKSN